MNETNIRKQLRKALAIRKQWLFLNPYHTIQMFYDTETKQVFIHTYTNSNSWVFYERIGKTIFQLSISLLGENTTQTEKLDFLMQEIEEIERNLNK